MATKTAGKMVKTKETDITSVFMVKFREDNKTKVEIRLIDNGCVVVEAVEPDGSKVQATLFGGNCYTIYQNTPEKSMANYIVTNIEGKVKMEHSHFETLPKPVKGAN